MKSSKKHQRARWQPIKQVRPDGDDSYGDYVKVGAHKFDRGYTKGRIALKWPDGFKQEVDYRTNDYEPAGSNGPHCHDTFIYIEAHGARVEIVLGSLEGVVVGRVLSCERDDE
jgi:hypothetical protein